jgi:hypothetical protein
MAAGAVAGERIRALAGDGVPGVVALVAGPEGVRAAGAAGLADIAGRTGHAVSRESEWLAVLARASGRGRSRVLIVNCLRHLMAPRLRKPQLRASLRARTLPGMIIMTLR